jgi:hypothetical protein
MSDSRITQLALLLENVAKGVSILQNQAADFRASAEARLTLVGSQLEDFGKGISILQHQVMDCRSSVEERLTLLGANFIGIANRHEDDFRRARLGTSSRGQDSLVVELYLNLIEDVLTGWLTADGSMAASGVGQYDPVRRSVGFDWPAKAETMIGRVRMRNLRVLLERALAEGVPGDFIETGVWRGGACIYARAILAAHGDAERRVFVADSFRGLPPPNVADFPADAGDSHSTFPQLAVCRQEVEENFRRYGMLDDRVAFLEGWFKDTLAGAPIERLCVLRLDGDMYESTIEALDALYHKVSHGGFVIVDDYVLKPCAQAVDEFRARHGIHAPLHDIDGSAVWWRVGDQITTPSSD